MDDYILTARVLILGIAAIWIGLTLQRRERTTLDWAWTGLCLAVGAMALRGLIGPEARLADLVLSVLSAGGCGTAWLVSRAVFRSGPAIRWPHLLLVSIIILPSLADRLLMAGNSVALLGEAGLHTLRESLGTAQSLTSSTVLVLAFWEALHGWTSDQPVGERNLRIAYATGYASCLGAALFWADNVVGPVTVLIPLVAALVILVLGGIAVAYRRRFPLPAPVSELARQGAKAPRPQPTAEETRLGRAIERTLLEDRAYLDAELKVAELAKRLREPEYKISRAITGALGRANFNQLVNSYRVAHAARLLADQSRAEQPILDIALESGFASLGPFNRAFKESQQMTPREYRRARSPADHHGRGDAVNFG
tara:strand:+ start:8906 stop:10009 length:1104 start_codon:yes stop_codon:yes gene_type:complete